MDLSKVTVAHLRAVSTALLHKASTVRPRASSTDNRPREASTDSHLNRATVSSLSRATVSLVTHPRASSMASSSVRLRVVLEDTPVSSSMARLPRDTLVAPAAKLAHWLRSTFASLLVRTCPADSACELLALKFVHTLSDIGSRLNSLRDILVV